MTGVVEKLVCTLFLTVSFLVNALHLSAEEVVQNHHVESQEIISYARDYRRDTELTDENEYLRQKNILESVFSLLPKYDTHNSLENAVSAFLVNELSVNEQDYTIINANLTDFGGKSHDSVFLINDSSGHLCYVVKAFRSPRDLSSKFLPEISALDFIQQLSMTGVGAINPIAFAIYGNQEEEWGLLLETVAKGLRMDQFIHRLGGLGKGSEERQTYFELCKKAFGRMAESFARLHSKKSSQLFLTSNQDVEKYNMRFSAILKSPFVLQEMEKRFSLDRFIQYVEKVKADALNIPLFHSYWHGDPHLGNLFYDEHEDLFYFIDAAKMHYSISNKGEPLLDGTIDLMRNEENFRRVALERLSKVEVEDLLNLFYDTYERHSEVAVNPSVLLFHRTSKKFERLLDNSFYVEEENPAVRATDQAIFENALEYFETQVKSFELQLQL